VNTAGDAVAVWSQFDGTRYNIWSNRYRAGTGWDNAVLIETDDAGDADRPQVVSDPSGNAIAVWRQSDGTRYNIWSNRYRAGTGWDNAVLIEADDPGDADRPQVVSDPSGNAIAVWQQSDGTNVTIRSNRYVQGAGWGSAIRIDSEGSGIAERPSLAMDPSGNAVAAWIWNDGENYKIEVARYR